MDRKITKLRHFYNRLSRKEKMELRKALTRERAGELKTPGPHAIKYWLDNPRSLKIQEGCVFLGYLTKKFTGVKLEEFHELV
jgi:hypothetical protein